MYRNGESGSCGQHICRAFARDLRGALSASVNVRCSEISAYRHSACNFMGSDPHTAPLRILERPLAIVVSPISWEEERRLFYDEENDRSRSPDLRIDPGTGSQIAT
jgi:hypothetical protein